MHLFVSTNLMIAVSIIPHVSQTEIWVHFIGGTILLFSFTLVRFAYAFVYFIGFTPLRSIGFALGSLINILILIWSIVALFV